MQLIWIEFLDFVSCESCVSDSMQNNFVWNGLQSYGFVIEFHWYVLHLEER